MANILINTNNLKQNAQELYNLSKKYDGLVNSFFETMNLKITNAWTGEFSNNYRNSLSKDKEIFLSYGVYLKKYANELNKISDSFQSDIIRQENMQ